jgi:SAM-dependent methyltransferase
VPFLDTAPEWATNWYTPTLTVDITLDPFSEAKCEQQIRLYEEISGRNFDQKVNEDTEFNFVHHVASPNPYASNDATYMALHFQRLSKMLRFTRIPASARVLDMGCGWGLTTEFFGMLGCKVTAIDINASFVELVTERNKRLGYDIQAFQSAFDEVDVVGEFDLIVFYECLHHAVKPWEVISRLLPRLAEGGSVAFVGEPVNSFWWPHWGMRLDPLSVYCMRKFGWFESGWSADFISACLTRAGLDVKSQNDADGVIGPVFVGSRPVATVPR